MENVVVTEITIKKEVIMPGGDKTGPTGMGPMTGRRMGYCTGNDYPGASTQNFSFRSFRGGGAWRGNRRRWFSNQNYSYESHTIDSERSILENQLSSLKNQIAALEQRLDSLNKEK
jgi:hypothetical protein